MATIIKEISDLVDALGVKDIVQLGTSLTQKGVDAKTNAYIEKLEERKILVEVPELYSSNYRLKIDDAKRWLEEDGLKAEVVVVHPNIEYKNCFDLEVVATNYKLGEKVKPGTRIILKYVTSEVIKASQKLFDEYERQKAATEQKKIENQEEKTEKKVEQNARNKQRLDETMANVQKKFNSVANNTKKGIAGISSKLKKNDNSNK